MTRVTCSCKLHRCAVCCAVDKAQDLASVSGAVDLWRANTLPNGWGQEFPLHQMTPVGKRPGQVIGYGGWSHVATVGEDGAVTWHGGWSP